ncbi:epimerase [Nonomuraea sp. NPDC050536]|uniref:epimerase n=1 Tax=Nonomuraea sp. NPDC050536 TaxID=3364366 RepID=UPI0037CB8CBC
MKVVLAGGSGALGRRIAADLAGRGDDIVVLTRTIRPGSPWRQVAWDGVTAGAWAGELDGAVLVNLAGELVDRPPTAANIALLTRSRVEPTRALALAAEGHPPAVWLQMSTLAVYGDGGEAVIAEGHPVAEGPPQMAGVARPWEAAAEGATCGRQVVLRTAVVFDPGTPALDRLSGLVRWGLGGRIASGRQWVSWLHIADLLAIVRRAVDDPGLSGVVHATSPNPVRNAELMATLRGIMRRPAALPTPAPLARLGALVLRTDAELALTGRRCVPRRLLDSGFAFRFPELGPALRDCLPY